MKKITNKDKGIMELYNHLSKEEIEELNKNAWKYVREQLI
jgi:hypothetical protein